MDVLGVNQSGNFIKKQQRKTNRKLDREAGIKVVYISSPMKVKTSASEFRSLVQKLTGQDSDAERFLELVNGRAAAENPHDDDQRRQTPSSTFINHSSVLDDCDREDLHYNRRVSYGLPTASYQSSVDMSESDDSILQDFDLNFTGTFQNFFHELMN